MLILAPQPCQLVDAFSLFVPLARSLVPFAFSCPSAIFDPRCFPFWDSLTQGPPPPLSQHAIEGFFFFSVSSGSYCRSIIFPVLLQLDDFALLFPVPALSSSNYMVSPTLNSPSHFLLPPQIPSILLGGCKHGKPLLPMVPPLSCTVRPCLMICYHVTPAAHFTPPSLLPQILYAKSSHLDPSCVHLSPSLFRC